MAQAKNSEAKGKPKGIKAERSVLVAAVREAEQAFRALPRRDGRSPEDPGLRDAGRRVRAARRRLEAFDRRFAKQFLKHNKNFAKKKTEGRGESRVGVIKVSRQRKVGDSQAVHRKRNGVRNN
jgi:hypothetical protein